MNNGELFFTLKPALPGWLFTDKGIISFTFLGKISVTYINPGKKNLFPGIVQRMMLYDESGECFRTEGGAIGEPWSGRIRSREVVSIKAIV
jgi:hypothetical protein